MTPKRKKLESCAIVVTFNPDMTPLLKLLGQLNKETDFIIIDNGSTRIGQFAESIRVYKRCVDIIRLAENQGLAQALNIGLKEAVDKKYRYGFLFDQDSSLCDLFSERMVAAYEEAGRLSPKPVAVIGPRIINPQTRRQTPFKLFNRFLLRSNRPFAGSRTLFQADFLITSGSLICLQHLPAIGGMKVSYFIDNVDLEWCFRAKSRGYELVGTDQAVLYHAIGERSENPLVRRGVMAQHNPSRTYYSSRNRIHLYGAPYSPIGWKIRDAVRFSIKAGWLLLVSPQRRQYWRNITAGIRDSRTLS
ncbi:MAG: glycosyltransferase family 2 protein [Pseudohongiellaceae bacterium]